MEGPISKFMHVQQPDAYWHQSTSSTAFKSPDLIELNSDTERSARNNAEQLNYSSSQEEAETEDDGCDSTDVIHLKEAIPGVYDVTSNDEESCHLLQTEDDSESSHSEHAWNSSNSGRSSRSSTSNGGTMSEGDEGHKNHVNQTVAVENYWDMTPEQEKYYTDQFLTLKADLNGLVSGAVAKGFFEKSKLPLSELREIWQLADVTRDGCLDISEFKMAMHLVVLRRHGLPIPSHFYTSQSADFPANVAGQSSLLKVQPVTISSSTPKASKSTDVTSSTVVPGVIGPTTQTKQSPLVKSDKNSQVTQAKRPSKEWTTFENEPINFSSTCDTSGLVAPVPVRLKTPEDNILLNNTSAGVSNNGKSHHQLQLKAIQRPKLSGHHPKISTGTIAPPPPPRRKTHVRSSSLDLNRLIISSEMQPQSMSANRGGDVPSRNFLSPCHQGGAFSVYRKQPQVPKAYAATIHEPSSVNIPFSNDHTIVQLEQEVSDLMSENELLSRVSTQLLDQLSGLHGRRTAVAYKIHHLHQNLS